MSNHRQRRLLRLRRERPRRCAAKQRNEVAPFNERPSWGGRSLPHRQIRAVLCITAKKWTPMAQLGQQRRSVPF